MDSSGIFFWAAVGKYRVNLTRNRVVYKIGLYETFDEAMEAKQAFLEQYELSKDESDSVPQYSREWFRRERKKQVESFTSTYGKGEANKPKQVTIIDRSWQSPSTENMLTKQRIQNDVE